ncbi:glycosyltransferase family 2 protein [Flavobacteriales bacterium]|nr:glycosyltransferase family 2 protein [Flavobacteriales bacterium]
MKGEVTVIIPCYNVEAYIHECLDSVVLQGDVVHHIYVVDNNSNDETVDTVRRWQNVNPTSPLTLLSQTKPGAPAARNLPLSRVETKWVQFLDADDLLLPGKIEDQIRQFPKADVICAGFQRVYLHGEKTTVPLTRNIPLALMQGKAGITSSNLFSTEIVQSVMGWDESLKSSQEYDLMFRVWQTRATFEVDLTPRALIRERQSGQISQGDLAANWTRLIQLRERMLTVYLENSAIDDNQKSELCQSFFDKLRILARHDLTTALGHFHRVLKPISFSPQPSEATTSTYILLFRILGFRWAERIKQALNL